MLRYDVRFWDKMAKRMIYGAGISPTQNPIVQNPDGSLTELTGEFVPMICTYQKAVNGDMWEGDVIECDVPFHISPDLPPSFIKARGVMQYNQKIGSFTVNIASKPETNGQMFQVTNPRIIGCAVSDPDLLQVNSNENENTNKKAE